MGIDSTVFGRERELARVRDLIPRADVHLVTVTGLPGVGKTRLARSILDTVPDGLMVPVSGAGSHAVGDAVLTSLAHRHTLTGPPASALWETFGGRPAVLVLDDADRADDLAAAVGELIAGYPTIVLVLTAARPTRIRNEHVIVLRPLPIPRSDADHTHPTVGLFLQRAAEVGVDLDTSDHRVRSAVIRVCRQTGGLPLAVELAAARTATQPLRFIERTLLRHRPGTRAHDRDRLRQSLESALSMVSGTARLALAQAAQFAAPFLLDAAEAVIELPGPGQDVYDALSELVDGYLLEFHGDPTREARFAMREPVRAFALELLDADALDAVRRRHASYFRDRCRAGGDVAAQEWPDVAQALDFAMRSGIVDDALIVGAAASPALRRLSGANAYLRRGLDRLARDHRSPGVRFDPVVRSRAMVWSTVLFPVDADDLATVGLWTAERLAEATALARESGDAPALLEALETTVRSLNITLDMPAAAAAVHEGLELARALDDQQAIARFEVWCAMEAQMRGNVTETVRLASAALTRGRANDEAIAEIWASRMLLLAPETMRPALDPPVQDLPALLEMCERAAQPYAGMIILGDLARRECARGHLAAAARWTWRQLMVAADRIHSEPLSTAFAVVNAVSIALRAGDIEDAIRMRESVRALEFLLPTHMPPQLAEAYAEDCARLERSVSERRYAQVASKVAGSTLTAANRGAQAWTRRLACRAEPEPEGADPSAGARLTAREREVLTYLGSGATNRDIAADLGVSPKTVMHHSVSIYRKLGVRGRAAAATWAARAGLLDEVR